VWVDLCNPIPSEIASVERDFGMEVPTREEIGEIEASSRLCDKEKRAGLL